MRRISVVILAAGVGVWLGAMLFVSFVLAPQAFATLESRHLAGNLIAQSLNVLYLAGYILGPSLVFIRVVSRPREDRRLWAVQAVLLVLMSVSTLVSREVVGTRLLALRRAMGGLIEAAAPDDPLRLLFQQWHQASVLLMLFNIAAATTVIALLGVDERNKV
jgi:hypothetical protein